MSKRELALLALVVVLAAGLLYQLAQRDRSAPAEPAPVRPENVVELFHHAFYNNDQTWPRNNWFGIRTLQNPNDVWITQEILTEIKPDFVIETGTRFGGSAVLWAMMLEHINPAGRVITIDIENVSGEARAMPLAQSRIDFLVGSSTAPEILAEVTERVRGGTVLVILDSDHSAAHVAKELELYGPLVSPGSYLIVQDTNVNGHPIEPDHGPGPGEAVAEFLPRHPEFTADRRRERLLFTMHPGGYLRRQPDAAASGG